MTVLIDKGTKIIIQGFTGKMGTFHAEEMIKNFSLDKKRKDNSNTFILIDNIGSAIIKDGISDDYLKSFMISNGFK